jgi:hypothetical protein
MKKSGIEVTEVTTFSKMGSQTWPLTVIMMSIVTCGMHKRSQFGCEIAGGRT